MNKNIFSKRLLSIAISALILIPSILPLFNRQFFYMHDFTHAARLAELDRGLKAGQIPPRWSDNFGWGYGMPLLHFYAPLFYYGAEVFYLLGLPAVVCIKIMIILTIIMGYWGIYKLGKQFLGNWGGILAATAFSYAPYRAVQLYVRGALTEMLATSFIPLVLWTLYLLIKNSSENKKISQPFIGFALALTGVLLSHNVISLIIIPLLIIWVVFWLLYFSFKLQKVSFRRFAILGGSGLFALALSAWFLIPAFFEKNETIVSTISGGYSYYKLHFVYFRQFFDPEFNYGGSILGPDDDISFQLGISQIGLGISSVLGVFYLWLKRKKSEQIQLYLYPVIIITTLLFLFLMSFHANFIWEKIPILQMAQFPWRFLSITTVMIALIGSYTAYLINLVKNVKITHAIGGIIVLLIIITNVNFFKPQKYIANESLYYTDANRIQEHMSGILKDYLPTTATENSAFNVPKITLNNQSYLPIDLKSKNAYRAFHVDSLEGGNVRIAIYDFIGWQVYIDKIPIGHTADTEYGFINFEIPSGSHYLELKLAKTKLQWWSDFISLICLISLIGYLGLKKLGRIK